MKKLIPTSATGQNRGKFGILAVFNSLVLLIALSIIIAVHHFHPWSLLVSTAVLRTRVGQQLRTSNLGIYSALLSVIELCPLTFLAFLAPHTTSGQHRFLFLGPCNRGTRLPGILCLALVRTLQELGKRFPIAFVRATTVHLSNIY